MITATQDFKNVVKLWELEKWKTRLLSEPEFFVSEAAGVDDLKSNTRKVYLRKLMGGVKCFNCDKVGHPAKECTEKCKFCKKPTGSGVGKCKSAFYCKKNPRVSGDNVRKPENQGEPGGANKRQKKK